MTIIRTNCNTKMLTWAREEAGLSIEQAAEAIGISIEKLSKAETKDHSLTLV